MNPFSRLLRLLKKARRGEEQARAPGGAKVERAKEPFVLRTVSRHEFTRRAAVQLGQMVKDYIPRASLTISPYNFAAQHVFFVFLSLPIAMAAPILALFVHPAFLVLLVTPLAVFVSPWLRLRSLVGDHRRGVDAELPFFAVHAAVSQSAGLNLFQSLCSLCSPVGRQIFKEIGKAALQVKRYYKIECMSPFEAVERAGKEHPHSGMQELLLGYTSEVASGGDVTRYLEDKADEHLRLTRYKHDRYVRDVGTVMEMVLSILLIVPVVLIIGMSLAPGETLSLALLFIGVGLPLTTTFCFAMIRGLQPRDHTEYSSSPIFAFLVAVPVFALTVGLFPMWLCACATAGAWSLAYGLPIYFQRRKALAHERSLPQFLRDVTEYQKLNYPVPRAILLLRKRPGYTPAFRELLEDVAKRLRTGRRLAEIDVPSRSWLTRMSFFHLGQVAESGGLSPRSTELLTDFITRVKEARDETRSSISLYRILAFATPLILAVTAGGMIGAIESFSIPAESAGAGTQLQFLFTPAPFFYLMAEAVVFLSGISIAFLASYATDFTPRNTVWVAIGAFVAAISISAMPAVAGWVGGLF